MLIRGRVDVNTTATLWSDIFDKLARARPKVLEIDASAIDYCDGAGIGLLLALRNKQTAEKGEFEITGFKPEFEQLMKLFDPGIPAKVAKPAASFTRICEDVGKALVGYWRDLQTLIAFIGELVVKLTRTILYPRSLRWKDTILVAEKSGADAVGLTALLGFLIGMILAFQSAIPMARFGAQIFVADLVVISLFRELGPLITAIILASRSGSAFAAELGTMKVNEEIDALTTMGLDPVRFLVIPRVIAAVFVIPLLTMFNHLFGLLGLLVVMVSLGFSPITYYHQIQQAATLTDLFGGLVKTLVFGVLIAGIGCLRGLQTGKGPSAVGDAATRAVVSGIISIVVADGIFAVVYYYLGI